MIVVADRAAATAVNRFDDRPLVSSGNEDDELAGRVGACIEIEQRDPGEVQSWRGVRTVPDGVGAFNPAFDVTPCDLVTAFITEHGVLRPPYAASLAPVLERPGKSQ